MEITLTGILVTIIILAVLGAMLFILHKGFKNIDKETDFDILSRATSQTFDNVLNRLSVLDKEIETTRNFGNILSQAVDQKLSVLNKDFSQMTLDISDLLKSSSSFVESKNHQTEAILNELDFIKANQRGQDKRSKDIEKGIISLGKDWLRQKEGLERKLDELSMKNQGLGMILHAHLKEKKAKTLSKKPQSKA